jgi:hypothetical protein
VGYASIVKEHDRTVRRATDVCSTDQPVQASGGEPSVGSRARRTARSLLFAPQHRPVASHSPPTTFRLRPFAPHSRRSQAVYDSSRRVPCLRRDASDPQRRIPHTSRSSKEGERGIPRSPRHPRGGEWDVAASSRHPHSGERAVPRGECLATGGEWDIPRSPHPILYGERRPISRESEILSPASRPFAGLYDMYMPGVCPEASARKRSSGAEGPGRSRDRRTTPPWAASRPRPRVPPRKGPSSLTIDSSAPRERQAGPFPRGCFQTSTLAPGSARRWSFMPSFWRNCS